MSLVQAQRIPITSLPGNTNVNGTITIPLPAVPFGVVLGVVWYQTFKQQEARSHQPFALIVNNVTGTAASGQCLDVGVAEGMQDPLVGGGNKAQLIRAWLTYPYAVQAQDTFFLQFNPDSFFQSFYQDAAGNYGYVIMGRVV